jgi:hypothetical protein
VFLRSRSCSFVSPTREHDLFPNQHDLFSPSPADLSTTAHKRELHAIMADDASPPTGHRLNPFSRRTSHSSQSILLYKVTTTLSYLLLLITAAYYTFSPVYGPNHYSRFWQIDHVYPTPFSQSATFTSIYWLILFVLQISYLAAFYSSSEANVAAAANIASHFIASNLLLFGFVNLWVREHFALAEFLLVITFANLSLAYFRHSTAPRVIHIATVSGPLAWTFVALYWVGAVAVWNLRASNIHFAARIVANVFIWGWLGYGVFFLAAYKDYTMGFALSMLSFCKISFPFPSSTM